MRRLDFRKHAPILLAFIASVPCAAQEFTLTNREFSIAVRNQDGAYEIRTKTNASVLHAAVAALVDHGWATSSQYPTHPVVRSTFHNSRGEDRKMILEAFAWLDQEAKRRFKGDFARLDEAGMRSICDEICYLPSAKPQLRRAAEFFARYRDLTAGGFYTTPPGRSDLQFIGDVPRERFDGPPPEVLKRVGLA